MNLSKNQLEICVHLFLTNTRHHVKSGIYAITILTFHKIMKNQIQGVYRVCTVRPKLGVFLQIYEIQHICCFITQLVKKLHQWSLCVVIEDILPFVLNTKQSLSDIWLLRYKQNSFGCFFLKKLGFFFLKTPKIVLLISQ